MTNISDDDICQRITQIRVELTGARGKAAFARQLGISPTTYQSYEGGRVPPADVLVRIADVADVSLRWLLTGQGGPEPQIPTNHPVLQRAAGLLGRDPHAGAALAAFVEILRESMKFPSKEAGSGAPASDEAGRAAAREAAPVATAGTVLPAEGERTFWIPILGRSAAGVPHFWSDSTEDAGLTTLDDLIERCAGCSDTQVFGAEATGACGEQARTVQLITLRFPEAGEAAQFVSSPEIKTRYRDAFAVRIDGESMSPDIRHGDVVILSPAVAAMDGQPAVIQLKRQIGVTCKLFRTEGEQVHLVPINEQSQPQTFSADQLVWALRVLARVRAAP